MKRLLLAACLIWVAKGQSLAPTPVAEARTGGWMKRHEAILARVAEGGAGLVMLGDSITQNYEKSNPPDEDFAPTWERYYAPRHAANLGISGDKTGNVLWRIEHGELEGIHPKAVVILIGTNDTQHGATVEATEAGIDAVAREVHGKLPAARILLMGILPSKLSVEKSKADASVNAYLKARYAGSDFVTFLDIGGIFLKDGALREDLFYDPRLATPRGALHPDTVGQRMMAEALEPALQKLMGER